jgi:hypothetical protein
MAFSLTKTRYPDAADPSERCVPSGLWRLKKFLTFRFRQTSVTRPRSVSGWRRGMLPVSGSPLGVAVGGVEEKRDVVALGDDVGGGFTFRNGDKIVIKAHDECVGLRVKIQD